MRFFLLILGVLTAWRLTHLLVSEDGPGDIIARLRELAGTGFWGRMLDCFHCLSLWIAAPLALLLGPDWRERLLLWPALSAGAILLERATFPGRGEEKGPNGIAPPIQTWNGGKRTMPCCGKRRRHPSSSEASHAAAPRLSSGTPYRIPTEAASFEYTGTTGIIVWGPATGQRYLFAWRGASVVVDGRDVPALSAVPNLRLVPN